MSERGSFTTEYIYCHKCFEEAKKIILENDKYLCSRVLPSWEGEGKELPIINGKIGAGWPGGDDHDFINILIELEPKLCHKLRVAILGESNHGIIILDPKNKISDYDRDNFQKLTTKYDE